MAKKPQCFRKQNSMLLPWLNSLKLDRAKGKIVRATKMQSSEVPVAGAIKHRETRAAAQHVHMDMKAQSLPTTLAFPPIINCSQVHSIRPTGVCLQLLNMHSPGTVSWCGQAAVLPFPLQSCPARPSQAGITAWEEIHLLLRNRKRNALHVKKPVAGTEIEIIILNNPR